MMAAVTHSKSIQAEHMAHTGWEPKKLSDLGTIGRGRSRHRPRDDESLYGGAYPFIQTGDVKATDMYVTEYSQTYNEKGLAQSKLWQPGTLCITIAANIAETAILKIAACFPDSVVGFIADPAKVDVRFIKYYIDTIKLRMQNISRGTTQDNLSLDKLLSFDILTPPLPIQRKIAAILSAYDDLIENNTRRIALLEAMAQALYREWFVRFRFPGHQSVPLVDSPLGPIPEGWCVANVGKLLSFSIGGGWGQDEPSDEFPIAAYVVRGTDILTCRHMSVESVPRRYHKLSNFSPRRLNQGDIVFEVSGGSKGQPVGRALFVSHELLGTLDNEVICASFCKLLRVDRQIVSPEFLYHFLLDIYQDGRINEYQVQSTGITNFKFQVFLDSALMALPDQPLMTRFSESVGQLYTTAQILGTRNANLRRTRDLLLPRLVSGEVDVSELEIENAPEGVSA